MDIDIYIYIFILVYPQFSSIFSIFSCFFPSFFNFFPMEITHPAVGGPWVAMETEVDTGGQGVGPSRGVGFQKPVG